MDKEFSLAKRLQCQKLSLSSFGVALGHGDAKALAQLAIKGTSSFSGQGAVTIKVLLLW